MKYLCISMSTFHRWGDLVFIVYVFPNWMVIMILSYWMRDFFFLIENYPTSLIGEIWFDLQNKQ